MSEFFTASELFEDCFFENGELLEYKKGQHFVWQKDKSEWVFFLVEGLARVSFSLPNTSNRIIGYFLPGMMFAQSGSFWGANDGALSYTAELPSKTYRMRRSIFLKILKNDLALMQEYVNLMLRNQIFLIDRIVYQGEKGLEAKCARWLLFMAKYYGKNRGNSCNITIPITQETAAQFVGATRESLNIILRDFADKGYVTLSTKKIEIRDMKSLRALIQ